MLAILYVSHGSRVAEGVRQANHFLRQCMDQINVPIQQICYLELVRPDIQEGISRCVRRGADYVIVQPILLLSAGHDKRDIPVEIEKARAIYPNVHFIYGRPFGVDDSIIDILVERIHEKHGGSVQNDSILIVGRGSSDPETPRAFSRICDMLAKRGISPVSVCYMATAKPLLKEGLELAVEQGPGKVYIVPYLLFSGILMRTIRESIETSVNRFTFVLCKPLGYHPSLIHLLRKRIQESIDYDRLSAQS
ncbi:sirohydrochlorin chelatase [Sporolactobacillus laevolacticus]|uniref:sirohydrochlorin chelatase n=1 Tax=Sporolactobacillus laevolacticus TaxID=33018 RepID=UPI0025B50E54|nr:sirohydrochlorin chelatase [Sporolactobacillus laevolacticus]MDN3954395.1 sirohydrochlorin chelatase [Sporolactobacillus laevolacticus]